MKRILTVLLAAILVSASVLAEAYLLQPLTSPRQQAQQSGFHVGVSFCGNTTAQAKLLIDKVKSYTNLFVVQSGPVSTNETEMNEIVDYAVAQGLDVIVAFGYFNPAYPWQVPWLDYAKQQWGSRFLGVYMHDEPGGAVIDANQTELFTQLKIRDTTLFDLHQPAIDLAMNGSLPFNSENAYQEAYHFVNLGLQTDPDLNQLETRQIHSFTSDYALYWFDNEGGYDTIFAEFGSNQSIPLTIALARGAASLQNKTWGTIITLTYDRPPYIADGAEMYSELVQAYTSGAKYAVIFDYPQIPGNPYGILTNEHFAALQKFWNNLPTLKVDSKAEAALVLPANYGWAMRSLQDKIWGIWSPADVDNSGQIWNITHALLAQYQLKLDIVYEDSQFPVDGRYQKIIYWNQTA